MKFSDTLKSERARLGLTQSEAAQVLMLPFRTYWDWENSKTEPLAIAQEGALARLKKARAKNKSNKACNPKPLGE